MSRTIPRAYVTAAWNKNGGYAREDAREYCRLLVNAGYMPICPILSFGGVFDEEDPDAAKKYREMCEDELKRARFLVICGGEINDDVREDISIAKRAKVIVTTLDGVLDCL